MSVKIHPYAAEFPMASDEELQDFAQHIDHVGQLEGFTNLCQEELHDILGSTYQIHKGDPNEAKYFVCDRMWKKGKRGYQKKKPVQGYVYFVKAAGIDLVKIGFTVAPKSRVETLQTGSPVALSIMTTMPGDMKLEREIQKKFDQYRSHGEWFRLTGEIDHFIQEQRR